MPEHGEPFERWLYAGAMAGLIGGAWLSLGLLGASAYAPYLSHDFLAEARDLGRALARMGVFLAGWTLMSIAMMLPSSLPLVTVFHTITSGAWRLVLLLLAGYLWIWALFGVGAIVADALPSLRRELPLAEPAPAPDFREPAPDRRALPVLTAQA